MGKKRISHPWQRVLHAPNISGVMGSHGVPGPWQLRGKQMLSQGEGQGQRVNWQPLPRQSRGRICSPAKDVGG